MHHFCFYFVIGPIIGDPSQVIQEQPETTPRVLILYSEDHEKHKECVRTLATFLHHKCNCKVRLDMWETTQIGDTRVWVFEQICNADKVIIIFSKGTYEKWRASLEQTTADVSDMFSRGYNYALDEFEKDRSLLSTKYVAACFEYSPKQEIPTEMRNVPLFQIPNQLEQLYLRLHDIPAATPGSIRRVRDLMPQSYCSTTAGAALQRSIEEMKALIKTNPHWYEYRRVNSAGSGYVTDNSPNEDADALEDFFHLGDASSDPNVDDDQFTDIYNECSEQPHDSGFHGGTKYDLRGKQSQCGILHDQDIGKSYEAEFDIDINNAMNDNRLCPSDTESMSSVDPCTEEQPLKTLDPSDVQLHSHPPELTRMDSGIEFSDVHLASTPFIRNHVESPV